MVTTRSKGSVAVGPNGATPTKRKHAAESAVAAGETKGGKEPDSKRSKAVGGSQKQQGDDSKDVTTGAVTADMPPKTQDKEGKPADTENKKDKLHRLLESYGHTPLQHLIPEDATASQVVVIHVLNALLSSARISHTIAENTLESLVKARYHDLDVLGDTTWEARCDVLTEGGYTRYREKTATYLGELSDLMKDKYESDGEKLLPGEEEGQKARDTAAKRLEEIKGLGPVGVDIFLGSIQSLCARVAPFLDKRSRETAERIGLGGDVGEIFEMVGEEAGEMAKVEVGLTMIRLEGKEGEFTG